MSAASCLTRASLTASPKWGPQASQGERQPQDSTAGVTRGASLWPHSGEPDTESSSFACYVTTVLGDTGAGAGPRAGSFVVEETGLQPTCSARPGPAACDKGQLRSGRLSPNMPAHLPTRHRGAQSQAAGGVATPGGSLHHKPERSLGLELIGRKH